MSCFEYEQATFIMTWDGCGVFNFCKLDSISFYAYGRQSLSILSFRINLQSSQSEEHSTGILIHHRFEVESIQHHLCIAIQKMFYRLEEWKEVSHLARKHAHVKLMLTEYSFAKVS